MVRKHDIDRIETELAVTLPTHYRDFLASFPSTLIETKADLGWKQEAPADREFRNDPDEIVSLNRDVRSPGTPWTEDEGPWPDRYFVIGDDECGNYWVIDLDSDDEGVWFYDHELSRFERQHESLQAFQAALVKEINEWNSEKSEN